MITKTWSISVPVEKEVETGIKVLGSIDFSKGNKSVIVTMGTGMQKKGISLEVEDLIVLQNAITEFVKDLSEVID